MFKYACKGLVTLWLTVALACPLYAQNFSYDGNRWYEIEVSIFSNQQLVLADKEITVPESITLAYPAVIRQLASAINSFAYNFDDTLEDTSVSNQQNPLTELIVEVGPVFSPAQNSFRLADFSKDAFIALGFAQHKFVSLNQKIIESSEHRLLFHALWRQPVLNKIQSTAIFIRGGDRYGEHNELEGSLMISFNVNRIDVDVRLWFSSFSLQDTDSPPLWFVPNQPFDVAGEAEDLLPAVQDFVISEVAYMEESRSMISNTFHYLDHPAFGLLIQVRPYQLPENFSQDKL